MNNSIHRETAKIFQFPVLARRRLENGTTVPAGIYEMAPGVIDTNCWYHEDAVGSAPTPERPKPC